jgi:hypothetical protein
LWTLSTPLGAVLRPGDRARRAAMGLDLMPHDLPTLTLSLSYDEVNADGSINWGMVLAYELARRGVGATTDR